MKFLPVEFFVMCTIIGLAMTALFHNSTMFQQHLSNYIASVVTITIFLLTGRIYQEYRR